MDTGGDEALLRLGGEEGLVIKVMRCTHYPTCTPHPHSRGMEDVANHLLYPCIQLHAGFLSPALT
ncbi:hypothetical protein EON64_08345 [archaeon]|nr:MAG: hypothetical protein EON64_08345 [archaeon]